MKILIITPTRKEFEYLLQSWNVLGLIAKSSAIGRLPAAFFPAMGITLAQGGAGKVQFGVQTQHLLDARGDWNLVVCAGPAGALVDEVGIGDLVVATATVEHDYSKRFNRRPIPSFESAQTAIADLRHCAPLATCFRVHFGVIASGDEDVIHPRRRKALQKFTGALAVAWEGAGGARACAFSKVPFVEVRGVTDSANHNANLDHESNVEAAMKNLATLIASCWTVREANIKG